MTDTPSSPGSFRDAFRELARSPFTPQTVGAILELLREPHERRGYTAPGIERDAAYGPDPRQRLDVHYDPGARDNRAPVLVWAPGGGFVGGTKWLPGTTHCDNIGAWACRHGAVAVVIDYRLAPEHTWPAAAEDVASALAWVRGNISAYGGDPGRIVLAGDSAGAAHVGSFIAGHGGGETGGIAALALVSGIYAPASTQGQHRNLVGMYYGTDDGDLRARSSVAGLAAWPGPLLAVVAEFDPADFQEQAFLLLAERFRTRGRLPHFVVDPGHLHTSDVFSLGIDHSALDLMLCQLLDEIRT